TAVAGRAEECDVHLPHPLVSRRHVAFSRTDEGEVVIRDLGSTNGTIAENAVLRGDEISVPGRATAHVGPFSIVISTQVALHDRTLPLDAAAPSALERKIWPQTDAGDAEPPPAGPPYPSGLSAREVDVLKLVASGRTNPEIGEDLVISPHTVARHLAHIFNKTGAANRAEAAAYAVQHGLTADRA
ncbi:MAG: LuxR C-terminal-related transcriptional regulator, partial [Dehalococcoidia bacterium]